MQLNEILEENSLKSVSLKTKIPEQNIKALLEGDFSRFKKIKTLGFISIIEREYKVDLSELKEDVNTYYVDHNEEEKMSMPISRLKEDKGKSKWFLFVILGLLGYVSWYFFTQFEQKQLNELLPYLEDKLEQVNNVPKDLDVKEVIKSNFESKTIENNIVENKNFEDEKTKNNTIEKEVIKEDISIENVIALVENPTPQREAAVAVTESETNSVGDTVDVESESIVVSENENSSIKVVKSVDQNSFIEVVESVEKNNSLEVKDLVEKNDSTNVVQSADENSTLIAANLEEQNTSVEVEEPVIEGLQSVSVVPVARLWFGVVEMDTKKRDQYSLSKKFELDTKEKSWLLATSPAPFSLVNAKETKKFKDAKAHYFKIDKDGIVELTKREYVKIGGWKRW